jgi:PAS domain S-box-containing protein
MSDREETRGEPIAGLAGGQEQLAGVDGRSKPSTPSNGCLAPASSSWHSLVANTPLFIIILDRDHCVRFINHPQPDETYEQVVRKTPYDYCLPEHHDVVREAIEQVFAAGRPASFEVQAAHPGAGNVWYRAYLGPIFESGEVKAASIIAVDVTAQKRLKDERDRAHAILNAAMECLPFDFFALGPDSRYMLVNAAARSHYPDSIGKTPQEVCPNEHDLVQWLDNNRRAFAGERVEGEVEATVEGERRHFYNVVAPIRDADQLYGILGVNMDITERVRAERELRESERRYRILTESIPQPLWRCDADGGLIECSRRWYEYTGQTPEEAKGNGWMEALHPDDLARIAEQVAAAVRGGQPYEAEYRLRRASDGSYRWHLARAIPMKDDQERIVCWFGSTADIDDRKQTQAELERRVEERTADLTRANRELRRSEERYRSLLEACPDPVVMSDLKGRLLFASRRTWELMRIADTESLVGRSVFDHVIEQDRERLGVNLADVIQAGLRRNRAYTMLRPDGTTVPVEASSAVIRDPNGKPKAVMAVIRDVTERRRAQQALERERRTLLHMVQAGDHERQTIAYDIHDGLAQQLAAAIMQLQACDGVKEADPAVAETAFKAGVEMVQQAYGEARRLISGVRPPILDESGITAAVAHLVYEHSGAAGPKLEFHSGMKIGRLTAVLENALYRIAQEALANAIRHSGSENVRVSLLQQGDSLCLEVRDWGAGFAPDSVDESHFGLEGIKERTRLLEGECSIESEPDKGTCVRVTLPIPKQK